MRLIICLLRFYQRVLSPLKPSRYRCRYYPTCSSYLIEAIKRFGVVKGMFLGVRRILSCHPWSKWGEDPVPKTWPRWKEIICRNS